MASKTAHHWRPVADYETAPAALARAELRHLAAIWEEQRDELERLEGTRKFNQRLRREWAIETGLLERLYTLDRGVTRLLIERGIESALIPHHRDSPAPEQVAAILRDHEDVIEGLFAFVRGDRALSTSYVKELHAQLTRHQFTTTAVDSLGKTVEVELLQGEYKRRPNSPTRRNGSVHEYCPPEQVASEMERLLELHRAHDGVAPEVEAAWLHHRFTQVHPFQDGNGRVARALASLVFLKAGWFPLVISDTRGERAVYLDALAAADRGDLALLVGVFAQAQKRAFVEALGASGQVLRQARAEQVIASARRRVEERELAQKAEWNRARDTADRLQEKAAARFAEIVQTLESEMGDALPQAVFSTDEAKNGEERDHSFRWQLLETAKHFDYFADTRAYRAWNRLVLQHDGQSEILLSFHGTGTDFRGVLVASACFFRREETEEKERQIVDWTPLSGEFFQVNYRERTDAAAARFESWLEEVLVEGLELWRKTL